MHEESAAPVVSRKSCLRACKTTATAEKQIGSCLVRILPEKLHMHKMRTLGIGLAIFLTSAPTSLHAQKSTASASSNTQQAVLSFGARQEDSDRPTLGHRNPRYQVMRDDVLILSFPLTPEFNQTVTIEPDGYVTLIGAGSVYIEKMTVPEVVEALNKAYSKILRDPVINVDLKDFQKPFFIVLGQVGKPGQYDLRHDTTVSEAIAIAGSLTADSKTQIFLFHRVSSDWVEVKKLSLKDIMHGKNANEDVHLQPGDMIFVPNNFISNFKKYVPYSLGVYYNPATSIP